MLPCLQACLVSVKITNTRLIRIGVAQVVLVVQHSIDCLSIGCLPNTMYISQY